MIRRVGRDEAEAAYFTLLRAREEHTALLRFADYLNEEQRRLQRFVAAGDALEAHVDPRLRRDVAHTDGPLGRAIQTRLAVIDEELRRLPARIEAATAFVAECEEELARARAGN